MKISELVSKLDYHFNTLAGIPVTDPEKARVLRSVLRGEENRRGAVHPPDQYIRGKCRDRLERVDDLRSCRFADKQQILSRKNKQGTDHFRSVPCGRICERSEEASDVLGLME